MSTAPSSFNADATGWPLEQPKFEIEKVQLQFDLMNGLQNLLVSNNIMYVFSKDYVCRIDLDNPSVPFKISLPMPSDSLKVTNSWLHPNGKFLLVQVNQTLYFHLHQDYSKFKVLPRFKGHDIEHVCFSDTMSDQSTGDFLFTTKDGNVYVACIKFHEPGTHDKKRDDKYVKQLYKSAGKIRGIAFCNNSTQIRLFVDTDTLVWDCFELIQSELSRVFRHSPKTITLLNQDMESIFLFARQNYYLVIPSTGDIYSNDEEVQMSHTETLSTGNSRILSAPKSFIATAHHLIFLSSTRDKLIILNKLTPQSPIIKDLGSIVPPDEKVIGVDSDFLGNTHWIFTSNGIHEIVVSNESISVWYNYYKMGNYEQALKLLNTNDDSMTSLKRNVVLVKQGYDLLQKGEFGLETKDDDESLYKLQLQGIQLLGKLQEPFEKICLMLLNLKLSNFNVSLTSTMLLVEYLKVKFSYSKEFDKSSVRTVVLSTWIVQLILRSIQVIQNRLRCDSEIDKLVLSNDQNQSTSKGLKMNKTLKELNASLDQFLRSNHHILDSKTIYEIMANMDFPEKLIAFAELLQEYRFILNYYVQEEMWNEALRALVQLYTKDKEEFMDAVQRTSTVLLINNPKDTVETWLRFSGINYETLLPAILSFNKNGDSVPFNQNPTVHLLLNLIFDKGFKSPVVNTYYLALLITYPSHGDDDQITASILKVLEFLRGESSRGYSKKEALYDSDFLLRLCLKCRRYTAAILVLIRDLQLFDAALKLALDKNMTSSAEFVLRLFDEHAIKNEDSNKDDLDMNDSGTSDGRFNNRIPLANNLFSSRKKLWLMYAKYLIDGVCDGAHFGVLDKWNDHKSHKQSMKELESNPVKTITLELIGEMKGNVDVKLKSEELNKVLNYLLHLSDSNDGSLNNLTLKDLLPMFPEDVLITSFKDEIVESLDYYNNRISQLTLEMQESAEIAEKLKFQILQSESQEQAGSLYTIIEPGEPCQLCGKLLIERNFVAFRNCHHCFHKDCTIRYYLQLKGDYRFKKIFQGFRINSSVTDEKELDSLLLSACLLCNESNLNTVDEFLIDSEKNKTEIEEWQL